MARDLRPDCIYASARPEFSNQINNVISGPYIFRAILDTQSTLVDDEMLLAAADAIAKLAKDPVPDSVVDADPERDFDFGPDYFIPSALDPRLCQAVSFAVAKVACNNNLAQNPIKDSFVYREDLNKIANN